jgi:hypothetical protein
LGLDAQKAKASSPIIPAFSYPWRQYHPDVPVQYRIKNDHEIKQITELQNILIQPFDNTPESESMLKTKLIAKNLSPLKFVCYSLDLQLEVANDKKPGWKRPKRKAYFVQLLVNWVSLKPFSQQPWHC